jgi:hypothetical protein
LAWAALLQVNYVLSYVSCETRSTWMLHLSAAIALAVVALGALAARRAWTTVSSDQSPLDDAGFGLTRAMALSGLVLCAWFALVIVATEVPVLVLRPCTP